MQHLANAKTPTIAKMLNQRYTSKGRKNWNGSPERDVVFMKAQRVWKRNDGRKSTTCLGKKKKKKRERERERERERRKEEKKVK